MAKRYTNDELKKLYQDFEDLVEEREEFYIVVDSQVAMRKGIVNALRATKIESNRILEATDCMEATQKMGRNKNSFTIITEFKLPDVDGLKFIGRVRKKREKQKDRFVFVSQNMSEKALETAKMLGTLDLIKKPCNPQVVIGRLQELGLL